MKKIIALILTVVLFSSLSKAEEQHWDYIEVKRGEICSLDGYLFSYDGLSSALARVQSSSQAIGIQKDKECNKIKLDLETVIKNKDSDLEITTKMLSNQLKIKQNTIDSIRSELFWSEAKIFTGIILGITAGYLVGHYLILR